MGHPFAAPGMLEERIRVLKCAQAKPWRSSSHLRGSDLMAGIYVPTSDIP